MIFTSSGERIEDEFAQRSKLWQYSKVVLRLDALELGVELLEVERSLWRT